MKGSMATATREQGVYPLSIATSMAIETLVDETKNPLEGFTSLLVNIRTLIRNIIGAVSAPMVTVDAVAETVLNELKIIETLISKASNGKCIVIPYYASLASVPKKFSHGLQKLPTTKIQIEAVAFEQAVIKRFAPYAKDVGLEEYDIDIDGSNETSYILTHYPIDLLSRYNFTKLILIESHTGRIKHPLMWYSKLYKGAEIPNIPFNKMTLQVFGDNVVFSPMAIKFRKSLITLAKTYLWSPMTTKDKILSDAKKLKDDPLLSKYLTDLYR